MKTCSYHVPLTDLPAGICGCVSVARAQPLSDETLVAIQEMALSAIREALLLNDETAIPSAFPTASEAPLAVGGEVRS